jgi:RND superfamily putative drug exporter
MTRRDRGETVVAMRRRHENEDPSAGTTGRRPPDAARPAHLAARAARWSVRHRKLAVGGWLLAVVLAILIGNAIGTKNLGDADYSIGEDARAQRTLADHGFVRPAGENVLIQRPTAARDAGTLLADPAVRAAAADVATRVEATGQVEELRSPVPVGGAAVDAGLVSADRRSVLVTFNMIGDSDTASDRVQPVLDAVTGAARTHPGLRIEQFGDASSDKALNDTIGKDFQRAELFAIPLTLGILLAVFGALVAALVPVGLALTAFVGALGIVAVTSRLLPMNESATSVMLLIGLAVGVDYALFYIRREREERAAGHGPARALEIAADTSGHAVLVSGLTVAVSMAGLVLTGLNIFSGVAVGTVVVVLVAILGSLTVLPALLSLLGDRVESLRLPWARPAAPKVPRGRRARRAARRDRRRSGRQAPAAGSPVDEDFVEVLAAAVATPPRQERRGGEGRDTRPGLTGRLLRHPRPVAAVTGGLLVLLALPAIGLHTAEQGVDDIPRNIPIMQTYQRLTAAFPGGPTPAIVVVSAPDVTTPDVTGAISELRRRAVATGRMFEPVTVDVSRDHRVARLAVPLAGSGTDALSVAALRTLRGSVIPPALGPVGGIRADVTGLTAGSIDFNHRLNSRTPLVIGFVLVLAFLLLLVAFRSRVVAAVAVGLNVLSVAASYGLLVLIFQHHWADGLLHYTSTGKIANWLPLFLFVVLFGLSMDYQVFMLSRIREGYQAGQLMRDAVRTGIRRSAGVVTSAAVIMVAVFGVFATLSQVSAKQLGIGLGAAILLDATVIRAILLPAVLTLIGDRAWGRPGGLARPGGPAGPGGTATVPASRAEATGAAPHPAGRST